MFYIPTSYQPDVVASPVIWLLNESIDEWRPITGADKPILVDVWGTTNISAALNDSAAILVQQYNVDRARYFFAGWSGGGNSVVIIGSQNQAELAGVMAFPGTGGNVAQPHMAGWTGHKIRLYYACGTADGIYPWEGVKGEADRWANSYGYQTRFERADGALHQIDEGIYQVRHHAWAWIKGFHLQN